MDMDTALNSDNKEHLQAEKTDDSCTTECVSGDCIGEVREVDVADLKQEPSDVCCVFVFITSERVCFVIGNRSSTFQKYSR